MTHTYNIAGMTCNGCVAKVKSELLKINGVTDADIKLEAPQGAITMTRHIPITELQSAIGKYMITDIQTPSVVAKAESDSYYPIFLIFGYIAGATLIARLAGGHFTLTEWMSGFMAGFFIVFSFFKLLNLKGFIEGYQTYDVVAKVIPAYAYAYPFIELGLGIAYITGFMPVVTNSVTLVVMGVSAIGVVRSLLKKTTFQCACLGTIIKLPLSKVTLFEDLLMVAMSAYMLFAMHG